MQAHLMLLKAFELMTEVNKIYTSVILLSETKGMPYLLLMTDSTCKPIWFKGLKATNGQQDDGTGILHQVAQFPIDQVYFYTRCPTAHAPGAINPFSSVRHHWRPPLFLPDSAVRHQWCPNKKGLKIGLDETGNKVRVRFFVGNTA